MDYLCFATLLCLYSFFFPALSLKCDPTTQYPWPPENPQFCCNKCQPGQYMVSRDMDDLKRCRIHCGNCTGQRYTDSFNLGKCKVCRDCDKENMAFITTCSSTHNAECRCKEGFTCANKACDYCKKSPLTTQMPTTTVPTTSVSRHDVFPTGRISTTSITSTSATKPVQDTVWFLIIIILLCLGLALVIVTKMKPVLRWFTDNKGQCLMKKPLASPVLPYEEDEPCTPVQEVCGKCDA